MAKFSKKQQIFKLFPVEFVQNLVTSRRARYSSAFCSLRLEWSTFTQRRKIINLFSKPLFVWVASPSYLRHPGRRTGGIWRGPPPRSPKWQYPRSASIWFEWRELPKESNRTDNNSTFHQGFLCKFSQIWSHPYVSVLLNGGDISQLLQLLYSSGELLKLFHNPVGLFLQVVLEFGLEALGCLI